MFFDDDTKTNSLLSKSKIVIATVQRNRSQCSTTVEGLPDDLDLQRICSHLRKEGKCSGSVINDGTVIQLFGNQKQMVYDFLLKHDICGEDEIVVKGL